MHAGHTHARARASTWVLVRRAPSASIGDILLLLLLLLLLLPHKHVLENAEGRKEVTTG